MNRTGKHGGYGLYARMLQLTAAQPMSAAQLGKATGFRVQWLLDALWRMEAAGIVHVSGWVPPQQGKRGIKSPVFTAGPGLSKPYPADRVPRNVGGRRRMRARTCLASFIVLVRQLLIGDVTRADLMTETGMAHHRIQVVLDVLRRADLAHRSSWKRKVDGEHQWAEAFTWGSGTDVPRPAPRSRVEINRIWRAARRAQRAIDAAAQQALPMAA